MKTKSKTTKPTEKPQRWVVMKLQRFDKLTTYFGTKLKHPPNGPHGFLAVFNTRKQAEAWEGSGENVALLIGKGKDENSN